MDQVSKHIQAYTVLQVQLKRHEKCFVSTKANNGFLSHTYRFSKRNFKIRAIYAVFAYFACNQVFNMYILSIAVVERLNMYDSLFLFL